MMSLSFCNEQTFKALTKNPGWVESDYPENSLNFTWNLIVFRFVSISGGRMGKESPADTNLGLRRGQFAVRRSFETLLTSVKV